MKHSHDSYCMVKALSVVERVLNIAGVSKQDFQRKSDPNLFLVNEYTRDVPIRPHDRKSRLITWL